MEANTLRQCITTVIEMSVSLHHACMLVDLSLSLFCSLFTKRWRCSFCTVDLYLRRSLKVSYALPLPVQVSPTACCLQEEPETAKLCLIVQEWERGLRFVSGEELLRIARLLELASTPTHAGSPLSPTGGVAPHSPHSQSQQLCTMYCSRTTSTPRSPADTARCTRVEPTRRWIR